jgi:hypothetical protein
MTTSPNAVEVYLEVGKKRTFAAALDWPGWSRGGKDEASALQALVDYGGRYKHALGDAARGLQLPKDASQLKVTERLKGDTTTDFGTPGIIPRSDSRAMDEAELRRQQAILLACWQTFDQVARTAKGKTLQKGPRGGGRDLNRIISHIFEAEHAYLVRLGWQVGRTEGSDEAWLPEREDILAGLAASAHGELPTSGPRGGRRWPARYYVRRAAWHILDHTWEIEDRLVRQPAQGK